MKKFLSVLLALCLTAFTLVPAFAAEETDAVIDSTWKILVSAGDTVQVNYAAKKNTVRASRETRYNTSDCCFRRR